MSKFTLKYIGMVTMRCALHINILFIIVAHTWLSVAVIGAKPHNDLLAGSLFQKEQVGPVLKVAHPLLEEEGFQLEKEALPLVKVAHRSVIDLLQLFFVSKPIHMPSYTPLVRQVGVRINYLELLRNLWPNGQKSYGGGVDLHLYGPIQLSVDIGYASYQPKGIVYGNQLSYRSKGRYGLGALLYVISPHHLSNAYFGIAYGQSRFSLITFYNDHIPFTSTPFVAGWIKIIGGSELRLVAQLYGGVQLGLARLLHCKKNDDSRLLNYSIPGYGNLVNKLTPDMTLYLNFSIFFLEKKIAI